MRFIATINHIKTVNSDKCVLLVGLEHPSHCGVYTVLVVDKSSRMFGRGWQEAETFLNDFFDGKTSNDVIYLR